MCAAINFDYYRTNKVFRLLKLYDIETPCVTGTKYFAVALDSGLAFDSHNGGERNMPYMVLGRLHPLLSAARQTKCYYMISLLYTKHVYSRYHSHLQMVRIHPRLKGDNTCPTLLYDLCTYVQNRLTRQVRQSLVVGSRRRSL